MTAQPAHTPETNLPQAIRDLHNAISALIDPKPHHTDQGITWLDPLYHQLTEAVGKPHNRTGIPSNQRPAPLWLDGWLELQNIDQTVRMWEPRSPNTDSDNHPTIYRLRLLEQRKYRPQDTQILFDRAREIRCWVDRIDDMLIKRRPVPLRGYACPSCGTKTTRRRDNTGTWVRVAALQVTERGATCQHCGEHWPPGRLLFLGRVLGNHIEGITDE